MKISYVHSICVRNDAISNSIREEIDWLQRFGGHDVRLFAYECNAGGVPFSKVSSIGELLSDPYFLSSDVVVFHFGIYYPLFDLLPMVPRRAKKLVVFHNVTPPEFVSVAQRPVMERSFQQLHNISWADQVICISKTNAEVLRSHHIRRPMSVVPLPVHSSIQAPKEKPGFQDGVTRVLFIGRFTRSKGVHELLDALLQLAESGAPAGALQIDLVGNLQFSDAELVDQVRAQCEMLNAIKSVSATLHGNVAEAGKLELLNRADVFVLPTYHEGFCVPILEALAAGCRIVAYDNSNVREICGGLGRLVPTGDVQELALSIAGEISHVRDDAWIAGDPHGGYADHVQRSRRHVAGFAPERVASKFLQTFDAAVI